MTRRTRTWAVGAGAAALVTAANGSDGAYFSQSWGWVALAFLCPVALALILGASRTPGRLVAVFTLLVAAFGAWVATSALWSVSPAASIRETERMLVYVALALAIAFVLRCGDAFAVAAGVLAGIVAISAYALATRLFQDRFDTFDDPLLPYRLAEPIGYWNALALLAGMGVVLALGFAAHARTMPYAAVAGTALPILATTLYFAFGRGAWAALGLAIAAMIALDPRRLRLVWTMLAISLPSVVAVGVASRQDALTTEDAPPADAVAEGHRLAVVVVVLALASGVLAAGAAWASRRVAVPRWAYRTVDAVLATAAAAALLIGVVLGGGPRDALAEIRDRFEVPGGVQTVDLNERLFTIAGNGRAENFAVAWDAARERPLLGHGAGSYEYLWYEDRPSGIVVRDAHSLYLETLSELGVVGLALLGLALAVPLVAAARARRMRFVPAAAGAYAAWLAHSGFDWDWEVVGTTVTALLAGGVALLASQRREGRSLPERARLPLLGVSVALTAAALVSLVGNQALSAGQAALARREWTDAAEHGRRAEALLFWSFEPHLVLGDVAARTGRREEALDEYRDAVEMDDRNWVIWLRLAQVARGRERSTAYERVHELNPRERDLPGEAG